MLNRAEDGISLYTFPSSSSLRETWIARCKMGKVPKNAYVCGRHFQEKDFISPKRKADKIPRYRKLKSSVVPSVNLPKGCVDKSPPAKKKQQKAARENRLVQRALFPPRTRKRKTKNSTSDLQLAAEESGSINELENTEPRSYDKECQVDTLDLLPVPTFTIVDILHSDESMQSCAGLSSLMQFNKLCESVEYVMTTQHVNSKRKLDLPGQVLLTLMKLKLNLSFKSLSCFFNISDRIAGEIFFYMIDVLHTVLERFVVWLPKDDIKDNMPTYFAVFNDTRVVLDCAETPVHKGKHTIKFMIGVAPSGVISF